MALHVTHPVQHALSETPLPVARPSGTGHGPSSPWKHFLTPLGPQGDEDTEDDASWREQQGGEQDPVIVDPWIH